MDAVLLLKIAGAAVTFALGVWIGLGMPGLKRSKPSREWQSSDRLRATWINRVFFRSERSERRFGSGLITPGEKEDGGGGGQPDGDSEEPSDVVRLRRTFER
ncbi:MAG: hypothetical protein JSW46_06270 [Gemmatimonadota bacterium]|nr:MAG: hypothetical protein JSW46_06270 [Gemmatimonadota bacterium]